MQCPRCGYQFNHALTVQERAVLRIVSDVQRFRRAPVPTAVIADLLGFTSRHTRRWLHDLERLEYVERRGVKGGWLIHRHEHAAEALAA